MERLPKKILENGMTYRPIYCMDCGWAGTSEPLGYVVADDGYIPEMQIELLLVASLCPKHAKMMQELEKSQQAEKSGAKI
jgi:hypothetical protein